MFFMELPPEEKTQAVAQADAQAVMDEPQKPVKTKTPMTHRKKLILIISACAVFVAAAAVTLALVFIEAANSAKYDRAVALMESNDLLKAKEEFLTIGGYKDSAAKAKECQNKFDFDSADALLRSEDYAAARDIFAALGDYSGARVKVNECDYNLAAGLLKNGEPEKAKTAFLALGDYSDSAKQAEVCQQELDYIAAADLLVKGEYQLAYDAFNLIKDYKDSMYQALACKNYLDYAKTEQLLADGKFYDAYSGFKKLGTFKDSAARMDQCIQENPLPGELYRNPDFSKKSRALIFIPSNDGFIRCFKVYKGDTLVSSIFISGSKKITIKLPVGTYTIKYAVGVNWFGPEDLFGDEGYYCKIQKEYSFGKYYWSFDLRNTIKGDELDTTETDRSDF